MNTPSNAVPDSPLDLQPNAPAVVSATRPVYWSIRREFWENRYLYIAPLAAAAVFLFGFLISSIHSPGQLRDLVALDSAHKHEHITGPFDISAALLMGTAILLSVFYCGEALHGERRDRSILFWKSLPVLNVLMLLLSSVVLLATGGNVAMLWAHLPIVQMSLLALYHLLTAHALWPAPVYCWLLLVSGWARRATFLWAVLPIVAIGGLEKLAFNTTQFANLVGSRFIGATAPIASTDVFPTNPMIHITPAAFLAAPGLWIGLGISAIFLAAAVRLRRSQGPI
jgi:ABC-2 type transport system permease protein